MKERHASGSLFTFPRLLACAFVLAAALRIGLALILEERLYWPDSNWHFDTAHRIASGQGFGPSLIRGPVYPYFLSVVFFFSSRILVVRICESFFSAFACVLVGLLGKRLFSQRVGLLAAFVCSVYPYFIYLPSAQVSDNIVIIPMLLSVLFLVGKGTSLSLKDSVLSGFFLGLSLLARPSIGAAVPGILVWPAFLRKTSEPTFLFRKVLLVVAVSLLTVAPWTIHNYVVTKQVVFIATSGGKQFWYGNSPYATGSTTENPAFPPELTEKLARLPNEASRERLLYREGLGFMSQHPNAAIRLYFKELANLFQLYPSVHTTGAVPQKPVLRIVVSLGSIVLFALAFLGAVLVLIKRHSATVLPLFVASYCLGSAFFLAIMRYRLPMDPYLILLGSAALAFFLRWPSTLSSSEF